MKAKIKTKTQEELFREKSEHYLVCFLDHCPLREQCLRWLVGQYADPSLVVYTAINPRNPKFGGKDCEMFRLNQRAVMKRGFLSMYHDMPGYMEKHIRWQLIGKFGRRKYFEMRKGDRLITPSEQQIIQDICRANGWEGPIMATTYSRSMDNSYVETKLALNSKTPPPAIRVLTESITEKKA